MSRNGLCAETSVSDPLLHQFDFPLKEVYYPLGFALRLSTNSNAILAAVKDNWGDFQQEFSAPPVELIIGVTGEDSGETPPPPVPRSRRHLLSLTADARNFAVCDLTSSFAYCWFTEAVLNDPAYLRQFFLDAIGYTLISHRHLAAIHGACVGWNGRGLLLCGPAGAGKSSLAYACARRGWSFISDDSSFLVRDLDDRIIIGNPHKVRFRPSAGALFPELEGRSVALDPNGKATIELRTSDLALPRTIGRAPVDHVLFLNRRPGAAPRLSPYPADTAFRELEQVVFFGEDRVRELQRAALSRLLSAGLHEFTYDRLGSAVDYLENLLAKGDPA